MRYKVGQKFKSINTLDDVVGYIVEIGPRRTEGYPHVMVRVKWSDMRRAISYTYTEFDCAFKNGDFLFVSSANQIWKELNK